MPATLKCTTQAKPAFDEMIFARRVLRDCRLDHPTGRRGLIKNIEEDSMWWKNWNAAVTIPRKPGIIRIVIPPDPF